MCTLYIFGAYIYVQALRLPHPQKNIYKLSEHMQPINKHKLSLVFPFRCSFSLWAPSNSFYSPYFLSFICVSYKYIYIHIRIYKFTYDFYPISIVVAVERGIRKKKDKVLSGSKIRGREWVVFYFTDPRRLLI